MLSFRSKKTIAIGEAMIEMAVIGDDTYRRSFAGDTFNTAWHMAQIPGNLPVGYLTNVGTDKVSETFVRQLEEDGLDTSAVGRVADRTMGLYMIELDGFERSFQYWRSESAARLLADDEDWLDTALRAVGLIHVSGITLAILSNEARGRLCSALSRARSAGAIVSFDPNVRPRLWSSEDEIRDVMSTFISISDIALPSFDDEQALWDDASSDETIDRFLGLGVTEVVVKNGVSPVRGLAAGQRITVETPEVQGVCDTSGAGDAFNAGYLAARLNGQGQTGAITNGQRVSSHVIRYFGARIPKGKVPGLVDG